MNRIKILSRHLSSSSSSTQKKPVILILGAGRGIGGNVANLFAANDYHAVLCRRSDQSTLDTQVSNIKQNGGDASGFLLDATSENAIEDLINTVEKDIGEIDVAVYNLGAQIGTRSLEDTSLQTFELGWKMGCQGLFRLAKSICPLMEARRKGTLLVTSATSAVRGNAGQHSHAAAMGGRRMLCQTLNAEYAPRNIHVSHIVVDGAVDAPDTLGKMLGDNFESYKTFKGEDGLLEPSSIAETYWHLHSQHRSAWTFEIDLRSYTDNAWFNSPVNMGKKF